ncbi:unnamed protein product [Onchocerca ochengi]|uniref:Ovule protein n=1 Tax=Onchocerca ochengi TaxID=42157 RepID=A0A182DYE4_ONCOC|nr:unnamed protein product [Onchocerca ochengi]
MVDEFIDCISFKLLGSKICIRSSVMMWNLIEWEMDFLDIPVDTLRCRRCFIGRVILVSSSYVVKQGVSR